MLKPTEYAINTGLGQAAEWIKRHRVDTRNAWPVSTGSREASLWGGTVDATRAIAALNLCRPRVAVSLLDDLDLHTTAQWIKGRQNKDGSFNSDEFGFAGAEPTAWALIALHAAEPNRKNRTVTTGLAYLESCIDHQQGDVSVSSTPEGTLPRTLPSALTLWAFALWRHGEDLQRKIIDYLLECQDTNHGWGVTSFARANPATTALVLVAFQAAEESVEQSKLADNDVANQRQLAAEYLVKRQEGDGGWPNSIDEWHTPHNKTAVQMTHKCVNSGTAWCLLALATLEDRSSRNACRRAVLHLLEKQSASKKDRGSWALWDDRVQRHVWLTCQITVALAVWHNGLPKQGIRRGGVRLTDALHGVLDSIARWSPLISTLGVFSAVVALSIGIADAGFPEQLIGSGTSFWQNLLASGLIAAVVGATTWVFRSMWDWHSRRKRR